jgi:hypothetical protein
MSQNRSLKLKLGVAGAILVVVLVGIYIGLKPADLGGTRSRDEGGPDSNPLEVGRDDLKKHPDFSNCRRALQQFNRHLTQNNLKPPPLSSEQRDEWKRQLNLSPDDLAELESSTFTLLDAHHIEMCFLYRDAARALGTRASGAAKSVVEEATAAFGWVVRQMYVAAENRGIDQQIVPLLALRRGFGLPLSRALVFLGLLDQLGHRGCLLALRNEEAGRLNYWACGVLDPKDQQIYLFDPRMGIPLPGPSGKGVATLAQMTQKDSPILKQLALEKDLHYDMTPEEASKTEVHLAPSLSALAPRMKFLETELLGTSARVHLATDPAVGSFEEAMKKAGQEKPVVRLAPWAVKLQRSFFPESEGGTDKPPPGNPSRQQLVMQETGGAQEGHLLEALLQCALNLNGGALVIEPARTLRLSFRGMFHNFFWEPGQPRDLVLRGQYAEATRALGRLHDVLDSSEASYESRFHSPNAQGPEQIRKWYQEASEAYADVNRNPNDPQPRAVLAAVRKKYEAPFMDLVQGSAARPLQDQGIYQQALCRHEEAERAHRRLDRGGEISDENLAHTRGSWKEACNWWKAFLRKAGRISSSNALAQRAAARMSLARAQQKLAAVITLQAAQNPGLVRSAQDARRQAMNDWQAAVKDLKDLHDFKDLQILACRFQVLHLNENGGQD